MEIDKLVEEFKKFYDKNESGGSSRWLVTPSTVSMWLRGVLAIQASQLTTKVREDTLKEVGELLIKAHDEKLVIAKNGEVLVDRTRWAQSGRNDTLKDIEEQLDCMKTNPLIVR